MVRGEGKLVAYCTLKVSLMRGDPVRVPYEARTYGCTWHLSLKRVVEQFGGATAQVVHGLSDPSGESHSSSTDAATISKAS